MTKRVLVSICLVMVLALFATAVYAQGGGPRPTPTNVPPDGGEPPPDSGTGEAKGSIRGTVYNDENADGSCSDEAIMTGVPIKFVNDRGDTTVYLQSGQNGTYGLVAAGLGQWTVTAEPGAGLIVTSQNPLQVFIESHNRLALNVDFCVSANVPAPEIDTGSPGSAPPRKPTVMLPTAGAEIAPTLLVSGLTGASLILAGFGIEIRRRRENDKLTKKQNLREKEEK